MWKLCKRDIMIVEEIVIKKVNRLWKLSDLSQAICIGDLLCTLLIIKHWGKI